MKEYVKNKCNGAKEDDKICNHVFNIVVNATKIHPSKMNQIIEGKQKAVEQQAEMWLKEPGKELDLIRTNWRASHTSMSP